MRSWAGERALAVGHGGSGLLMSGDVEEGVEEETSDALAQDGRPDWLAGARGAEMKQPPGPVHSREALPYCGQVVDGKSGESFGECGGCR